MPHLKTIKKLSIRAERVQACEDGGTYNVVVSTPETIARIAQTIMRHQDEESFLAFILDVKNRILGYVEVGRGGPDSCPVDVRSVFRTAVLLGASSVIVAHNHPSGDTSPSKDDLKLTKRLQDGGDLLEIRVLDHLIVTEDSWKSLREQGLM